jgi:hypothetical protein
MLTSASRAVVVGLLLTPALAGCDRASREPVPLRAVVLHDVQGLWGGEALWARDDRTAVVQVVRPPKGDQAGLWERRYAVTLTDAQWAEVERLVGAHRFLSLHIKERTALPDTPHPLIWVQSKAGVTNKVMKWADDRHPDFDPVYEYLLGLCRGVGVRKVLAHRQRKADVVARDPVLSHLKAWFGRLTLTPGWPRDNLNLTVIDNGDGWFGPPDDYGRLHTPVTSLHRPLRSYLRIDGQPLVGVDVSCSQPLLAGLFFSNPRKISGKVREGEGEEKVSSLCTDFACRQSVARLRGVREFLADCSAGRMYERLMSHSEVVGEGLARDAVKRQCLMALYWVPGVAYAALPTARALAGVYPGLWACVRRFDDGQALSHVMQRLESDIVIRTACGQLARDHPDVPVITIHDCICTTAPHVDVVERVMRQAFPVPVTLKRQSWDARAGLVEERLDGEVCKAVAC